uniref:CUB domain-containing protein n=1 Tax=Panagrellus redivivus TaxID=6233 RepID=A0A7E4W765_PANRE
MNLIVTAAMFIVVYSDEVEVAKEVEGGVQLISIGSIELILPEVLNFTLKRVRPSQKCVGDFIICYEATTTLTETTPKPLHYMNYWPPCPSGTCVAAVLPAHVYSLSMRMTTDYVYAFFNDDSKLECPRKVVDNRANFTIKELPDCAVIVNGARLLKDESTEPGGTSIKWIVIICVTVVSLLVVASVAGFCIFTRCRDNAPHAKSEGHDQPVSKVAVSPMTRNKPSPMNTPVDD